MVGLGDPPGGRFRSYALNVSADGQIVVGHGEWASGEDAFIWDAQNGMRRMVDWLASHGVSVPAGWGLKSATGVTVNGYVITVVGNGTNVSGNPKAWIVQVMTCRSHSGDVNRDFCVDDADLLAVLFAFGNTGSNHGRVDVNCDETVDDADLLVVLFNFGSGC
ncbi:MAG: hypothetical protein SNJ72_06195 [Fimbriimonadales bacterium]